MQRRELLALAGIAGVAATTVSRAQVSSDDAAARLHRFYATADGESHHQLVAISDGAGAIPVTSMTASVYARSPTSAPNWHAAPSRQFAINMTGTLEVEVSDGSRHRIGQGDLVFLEDITGKGHVTRVLSPVTNLFIHVPQDWDMLAWAMGTA